MNPIPFAPPFIDQSTIDEVVDTLRSGWITTGPKVKALEEACRTLSGSQACACVNSWTSGAQLVLHWLGVGPGDEVIIPAYTYAATALVVMHAGATPVMVDVLDDFTIDPVEISRVITPRTKAIISVDIAGWPCDYKAIYRLITSDSIVRLFRPANEVQQKIGRIMLISDAAHSIGARVNGLPAASCCDISIYSLHAVKNVTTAEGGVICLNLPLPFDNQAVYRSLKLNSLNGQTKDAFSKNKAGEWRYDIISAGFKMNMPDVCAAIGLSQIRQYETHLLPARKRVFDRYTEAFRRYEWAELPPGEDENRRSSYHLFPLRITGATEKNRDDMIRMISLKNIAVNVHFIPLPMLTLFKNSGFEINNFPNSYHQYSREISLPIYPQLTNEQIDFIIENVVYAYEETIYQYSDPVF